MTGVTVKATISDLAVPVIDDATITAWIEDRLNDGRNTFVRSVSRGGGGGRVYGRRKHHASAPGEYPVTDGGRLVNSVDTQMHGAREGALTSDVLYAAWLTDGTKRMAPRKMLKDALTEALTARPQEDQLAKAVKLTETTTYGK